MRTLLLLRHAKSDWKAGSGDDRDRPLNRRGRAASRIIGRFLAAADQVPDLVLSSPAARAWDTARRAARAGRWRSRIEARDSLYGTSAAQVLPLLPGLGEGPERVCLVGHEPAWSELAAGLIGHGRLRMPTAAVACIRFDVEGWNRLRAGEGTLLWLVTPRLLEGGSWPPGADRRSR